MKSTLPLLSLALAISSCTTAYKSGQTPDDVYFSPARPQEEYVQREDRDDQRYQYDEGAYRDDRYLRMKIRDHRYGALYDDYYSYNPYYYHYYNGYLVYNSPFTPVSYWDYYYSPYHGTVLTCMPKSRVTGRPRIFDLNVYNPPPASGNNKTPRVYSSSSHGYNPVYQSSTNNDNYRGSGSNAGNFLRDVFGSSGSSSSSSGSSSGIKGSSGSSSSSSNGSSGSSGSTNAPARKF